MTVQQCRACDVVI